MAHVPTAGIARLASLAGFFALWQLVVWLVQPDLLPGPLAVFSRLISQWQSGELPGHLFITIARVFGSFSLAMVLGLVFGMLLGHSRRADLALDGLLTVFLNIPALVVIILCFIWFGLNEVAVILAVVLNKAPTMTVIFREGVRAIDRDLLEVGEVYGLSRPRRFLRIYLPQLYPYFLAATRSGLALVWKIVLVVELLGCSEGLGFQLGVFFQYFDITGILAYTFAFVLLILLIEGVLLRPAHQLPVPMGELQASHGDRGEPVDGCDLGAEAVGRSGARPPPVLLSRGGRPPGRARAPESGRLHERHPRAGPADRGQGDRASGSAFPASSDRSHGLHSRGRARRRRRALRPANLGR